MAQHITSAPDRSSQLSSSFWPIHHIQSNMSGSINNMQNQECGPRPSEVQHVISWLPEQYYHNRTTTQNLPSFHLYTLARTCCLDSGPWATTTTKKHISGTSTGSETGLHPAVEGSRTPVYLLSKLQFVESNHDHNRPTHTFYPNMWEKCNQTYLSK